MKFLIIIAVLAGLTACDQKGTTDAAKERASAEQEGANKAENENLAKKAEVMERDLARRHAFYSALEGEYEGTLRADGDRYQIRITLTKSIPPFTGERIRQLSEIEYDLNSLYFYIQVVQWYPGDEATAVGCRVSGLRPNMEEGTLKVASTECPNLYNILLSEGGDDAFTDRAGKAKSVAKKIKTRASAESPYLIGTVQPSSNAMKYTFRVKKVK